MASAIQDGTNIDLSVFSYTAPKANPAGGKVVNLLNKHFKESLTISVPLMGSWGAQEVKETIGKGPDGKPITRGTGKYTMTLQFARDNYTTPDADAFLEQMKAVENKIKQDAMIYSKEWFGKEIKSMDVMDEKISPMLKYPRISKDSEERDYSQPPQLSLKVPCWKGVWQPSIFDEEYNPLYIKGKTDEDVTPLDFLKCPNKAPIQVICLIQCAGLWFVGNPAKVSITWNLKQAIVKKPKSSSISDDMCFLTIKPSDKIALQQSITENHNENEISAKVEDSDEEEEEEKSVIKHNIDENSEDYKLPLPQQEENINVEAIAESISIDEPKKKVSRKSKK